MKSRHLFRGPCSYGRLLVCVATLTAPIATRQAAAHFPWLATDESDCAILFFSESPAVRNYRVPECMRTAHVSMDLKDRNSENLNLALVESDRFVGRRSEKLPAAAQRLASSILYGNYNGMLLRYHAKACLAGPESWLSCKDIDFDPIPRLENGRLAVVATWKGRPAANCKATLLPTAGDPIEGKTDEHGIVRFAVPSAGLTGLLVERTDSAASGRAGGAPYSTAVDYATCTFVVPADAQPVVGVPPLPEGLASFGGAVCGEFVYVYGGHVGEEHVHSRDNLSQGFRRAKISAAGDGQWESLPMQTPLQGLPLVARGDKLYRIGGLSMTNKHGEPENLQSVAEVAVFDAAKKTWAPMPPLPEPRSSHDAAVIDDEIFVVGGWRLTGKSPGTWLSTAWKFSLARPDATWEPIAAPPFKRRALAVAAWNGKIVALGGMADANKVSRFVDLYDPVADSWSQLPDLPGDGMDGFGVGAMSIGDRLYASSADGVLYALERAGTSWNRVCPLSTPRFFHRLLPSGNGGLLVVAGASPDDGHLTTTEFLHAEKL